MRQQPPLPDMQPTKVECNLVHNPMSGTGSFVAVEDAETAIQDAPLTAEVAGVEYFIAATITHHGYHHKNAHTQPTSERGALHSTIKGVVMRHFK